MIIAFLGEESACDLTKNMLAVSLTMFERYAASCLLIENQFAASYVQRAFSNDSWNYVREEQNYCSNEGMDYLFYRGEQQFLNEKTIREGITILHTGFGYLKSAVYGTEEQYERNMDRYGKEILHLLDRSTDYVFLNCRNGQGRLNQMLIEQCDLLVCNQSEQSGNGFLEWFRRKNNVYVLYSEVFPTFNDESSRMMEAFWMEGRTGVIPYNSAYTASYQSGKTWYYFHKSAKRAQGIQCYQFQHVMIETARQIMKCLELV